MGLILSIPNEIKSHFKLKRNILLLCFCLHVIHEVTEAHFLWFLLDLDTTQLYGYKHYKTKSQTLFRCLDKTNSTAINSYYFDF